MNQDPVIEAINNGTLTKEKLKPQELRKEYRRNIYEDGRSILERGRGVLKDADQLDQYLYSYANMSNKQWENMEKLELDVGNTHIIDYGCGQGLSLLNVLNKWQAKDASKSWELTTNKVTLIEPSTAALNRAKAIAGLYFPGIEIKTINKGLETLTDEDLDFSISEVTIHIFSQVLDMEFEEDFNIINFIEKITAKEGLHYLLIVSHHIEEMDSSRNILKLYKHLVANYIHDEINLDSLLGFGESMNSNIKNIKNIALNNFEIESSNGKEHSSIAVFACIETK
ncbi:hypothetical protein A9Z61_11210 [Moraxella osloensis]|nr:hypothetical protein [Moraxella osloensis]OBX56716.1 hypothetical protein A9Z61_11210 [Moraxella osloensis]